MLLADAAREIRFASYSPDGGTIVYQAETESRSGEVCLYDIRSGRKTTLVETKNPDVAPVFSQDGGSIIFQSRIDENTEICRINADGTGLSNLTNNPARDMNGAFSPDGKQIVFVSNRGGDYSTFQIYVMDNDGSEVRRIYGEAMNAAPAWSPDGQTIAFANDKEEWRTGNFEIFTLSVDAGGDPSRLTFRRRADSHPRYSPDGRHILFTSNSDGNSEIYLMRSDGSGVVRLTRNEAVDASPVWNPDGRRITFCSNRGGKFAVYEIDAPAD